MMILPARWLCREDGAEGAERLAGVGSSPGDDVVGPNQDQLVVVEEVDVIGLVDHDTGFAGPGRDDRQFVAGEDGPVRSGQVDGSIGPPRRVARCGQDAGQRPADSPTILGGDGWKRFAG